MKKKPPVSRILKSKPKPRPADETWHNGADVEILFYARSLQKAAKALIETLDLEPNPKTEWDDGTRRDRRCSTELYLSPWRRTNRPSLPKGTMRKVVGNNGFTNPNGFGSTAFCSTFTIWSALCWASTSDS